MSGRAFELWPEVQHDLTHADRAEHLYLRGFRADDRRKQERDTSNCRYNRASLHGECL
jgi:hypothetical protein